MPRLLIIGVDGLPPALLRRLCVEGVTPNLAELVRRGSAGVLRSTPNYQSASAWTSMMTGVNPGKHGILHFTNPVAGSYRLRQIDARARRCRTVWSLLSEAGARVAALNVPVSYPAEPVNGHLVAGWLCPSPAAEGFTHPPGLAGEIAARFGDYPIHPDVRRAASGGRYDRAAQLAERGIAVKFEVARWLIERERPDVACVVVTEPDSLQHWCGHLLDEDHPEHDAELSARFREDVLNVFAALDREIGCLLSGPAGEGDVLVVSDHGQAPTCGGQLLLRPWLVDAGYLVARSRPVHRRIADVLLRGGMRALRDHAPGRLKAALRARLPGLQTRAQAGARGLDADWERTQAWTETGHIFVNLRGRQPLGIVEPGGECEALVERLSAELSELADAASGERPVASVTRGADEFSGPFAEMMPDLLVHWRHDLRVHELRTPGGRIIRRKAPPRLPPGAHHPDGTLVAAGPHFTGGLSGGPRSIYDIAPTVMHLLGRPVPTYMDGSVMCELLTADAAKDIGRRAVKNPYRPAETSDPGEDEVVRRRLRSLGYIE